MPRWPALLLALGLLLALATACGGGDPPPPTIAPELRTATAEARDATATHDAEQALLRQPPCLLDAQTLEAAQAIADELWEVGNLVGPENGSLGLDFYEASIAYGLLNECRPPAATPVAGEVAGTPAALVPPPIACPPDPEGMSRLRGAPAQGVPIMLQLVLAGVSAEDLELMSLVNAIIWDRIDAINAACGLSASPAASPVASPVASPSSNP